MSIRIAVWPLLALVCPVLVACNWVDSTGNQGVVSRTEIFLDDSPVDFALVVNEKTRASIVTIRGADVVDEQSYEWGEAPLEQGALAACATKSGFNMEFAANTLEEACTDPANCSVGFTKESTTDGATEFSMNAPELKAPVGMRFALSVSNFTGVIETLEYDFCFVAVNEAPEAKDDTFVIREGVREVFSIGDTNLMSNDSDDDDVSNEPLHILPEPTVDPNFASFLELNEDGSFTYESSLSGIVSDQIDTFEYALSDGVFTSTARVTLRIVASNQAPEQLDPIPVLSAVVGEFFAENLSLYFADPEEGDLDYSFIEGDEVLLEDGELTLTGEGVLSGTPILSDVGTYELQLLVSDGGQEIESLFTLEIIEPDVADLNTPPVYVDGTVFNQILFLGAPISAVFAEFIDAEDDELEFSMFGEEELPDGVTIDSDTGIITGLPLAVTWVRDLRVVATDPSGAMAVSDSFYIRVR